jgi:hypothetical protein
VRFGAASLLTAVLAALDANRDQRHTR